MGRASQDSALAGRTRGERGTRSERGTRGHRGFTLLEVMIALAILAFLMAAISTAQGSSLLHGARVYNLSTATQLIDAVVMDIEEEYRLDGFPENSLENRDCDLPRGFDRFECEYDLVALDVSAENVSSLVGNSPLMAGLCSGGANGGGPAADPMSALQAVGVDSAALGALQVLMNPQFVDLCKINLQQMCMNIPMMASFIPTIIQQAALSTRKLRIRIAWDERGNARKTIEIETFIVAVPEAEEDEQETRSGR